MPENEQLFIFRHTFALLLRTT